MIHQTEGRLKKLISVRFEGRTRSLCLQVFGSNMIRCDVIQKSLTLPLGGDLDSDLIILIPWYFISHLFWCRAAAAFGITVVSHDPVSARHRPPEYWRWGVHGPVSDCCCYETNLCLLIDLMSAVSSLVKLLMFFCEGRSLCMNKLNSWCRWRWPWHNNQQNPNCSKTTRGVCFEQQETSNSPKPESRSANITRTTTVVPILESNFSS